MDQSQEGPQDAEIVKSILESMGTSEYEPRVVEQLMSFMYRYTAEVLQDAEAIATRSGAAPSEVGAQDVMVAIQARSQHAFVPPPPQPVLVKLAENRNRHPLPELRQRHGLRIPPEGECLLNPNFQIQPPPLEPSTGAPVDAAAAEARASNGYNVAREHKLSIVTPGEGWQPPPDAPAGAWPGAAQSTPPDEEML